MSALEELAREELRALLARMSPRQREYFASIYGDEPKRDSLFGAIELAEKYVTLNEFEPERLFR